MSSNSPPMEFLLVNGFRLPFFILYIVGFVLALTTWRRHPRASLFSLVAFVLLFSAEILDAGLIWFAVFKHLVPTSWLLVGSIATRVISLIAWIYILFALFARRPWQLERFTDERERYPSQYPERDAPLGPASQDIRK
jgi:hypothetical protein